MKVLDDDWALWAVPQPAGEDALTSVEGAERGRSALLILHMKWRRNGVGGPCKAISDVQPQELGDSTALVRSVRFFLKVKAVDVTLQMRPIIGSGPRVHDSYCLWSVGETVEQPAAA